MVDVSDSWGSKITYLADVARDNDCDVASLDYAGIAGTGAHRPPHFRLRQPSQVTDSGCLDRPKAMTQLSSEPVPAHACYLPGYPHLGPDLNCASNLIELVHGWREDVVPTRIRCGSTRPCGCDGGRVLSNRLTSTVGHSGEIGSLGFLQTS